MKPYRKHQRIHSDDLVGDIPKGWYMVLKVYETLEVLFVQFEGTGKTYTVVSKR